jgi:putative two-component system response regulator
LCGVKIPESARIVAVADVFDALSMKRPYKDAWPIERIVDTINQGAGAHFDPDVVRVFTSVLPRLLEISATWAKLEEAAS